jgi:uncharacterized protein (DUF58 family)
MLGQQDSVGLVTFDTKVRRYIPPRAQTSHLKVLVNELEATKPAARPSWPTSSTTSSRGSTAAA